MGNKLEKNYERYEMTCHPLLKVYTLEAGNPTLTIEHPVSPLLMKWQSTIFPLLEKRYLFMPKAINGVEEPEQPNKLAKISYPCFIFCLDKEMVSRRNNDASFREIELWKIMNYILKAVVEWQKVFPIQHPGAIELQSVLLDCAGNVKLLTKYSCFKQPTSNFPLVYCSPQCRQRPSSQCGLSEYIYQATKINQRGCEMPLMKSKEALELSCVYNVGILLLQLSTLRMMHETTQTVDEKVQEFANNTKLSKELKRVVARMVEPAPNRRIGLQKCLRAVKENKTTTM